MHLTPRRRAVVAMLAMAPLSYFAIDFGWATVLNLGRNYRAGYVSCTPSWKTTYNDCTRYSAALAWVSLLLLAVVWLGIAVLLARWVLQPVAEVGRVVRQFGPTSLGLRVNADGSRDELRRLADEVNAMLDRLAESYEAQRRFASNASHELRTPLATQRALIEVSLAGALTEEQLALLSRQLLATNERNERLIDGLLTLAETERGLMASTLLRFDVVVCEAAESLRRTASAAGVTLEVAVAPVNVHGEQPLLDRLVTNLVSNAIKYNNPGGSVAVRLTPEGALIVRNTGPEVPPEAVPGLFEPFRRLDGERLYQGGGVGLGLTIARSIVAAHGGYLAASANPGGGLTVEVRLKQA
jgi:signal transduction histidine kinase